MWHVTVAIIFQLLPIIEQKSILNKLVSFQTVPNCNIKNLQQSVFLNWNYKFTILRLIIFFFMDNVIQVFSEI